MTANQFLPEPLPAEPISTFMDWFQQARRLNVQPNPDAMVLATIAQNNGPTGRVVLCKRVVPDPGFLVFFTNYESAKSRELTAHPRACAVFYWDSLHRQVRIEGPVVRSPAQESDEYFATRPFNSRVGAWASKQSEPLASRAELQAQLHAAATQLGFGAEDVDGYVPRPPHWGGFRLWIDSLELWVEGPGRIHDRALWTRDLVARGDGNFQASGWNATRLNP